MAVSRDDDTRGIVGAAGGFERFDLVRREPSPDLDWAVDRCWTVRWDLRDQEPYDQRVIPHPAVHLVFEAGLAHVQAISTGEFVRHLDGRRQVLGVKFRPAGFRPFLGRAVSTITGHLVTPSAEGPLSDMTAELHKGGTDLTGRSPGRHRPRDLAGRLAGVVGRVGVAAVVA